MQSTRFLSLVVQGIYVFLTGLELIFVPNIVIGFFGFEPSSEIWIKVLGVVVFSFTILYYNVNKYGSDELVRTTIWLRFTISTGFILLSLSGQASINLILFAGIDVMTAVWTWFELKKQSLLN